MQTTMAIRTGIVAARPLCGEDRSLTLPAQSCGGPQLAPHSTLAIGFRPNSQLTTSELQPLVTCAPSNDFQSAYLAGIVPPSGALTTNSRTSDPSGSRVSSVVNASQSSPFKTILSTSATLLHQILTRGDLAIFLDWTVTTGGRHFPRMAYHMAEDSPPQPVL